MKKIFPLVVVAILLGGCFSNNYIAVREYDLASPQKQIDANIRIGVFYNLSGAGRKFMTIGNNGTVKTLEYDQWTCSPDIMLKRMLSEATISRGDRNKTIRIDVSLYRFAFNVEKNCAELSLEYNFARGNMNNSIPFSYSEPIEKTEKFDATKLVAAMNVCVNRAIADLDKELEKLK